MSLRRYCLLAASVLLIYICVSAVAFAAGANDPAPMQRSARAFSQGKPVSSIVLSASAEWIAGSDDETGTATLTANADGSFSVQLNLPKNSRAESQTSFASGQSCTWSGSDGVAHATPPHNCMSSAAWFLPSVAIHGGQQPSQLTTTFGAVSISGMLDVEQQRQPSSSTSSDIPALFTYLCTTHVYLDANTYLPAALFLNMHPDDNSGSNIPMHVVFSNYKPVDGVMIPYRIQRYLNGTLNLDLTVTQASVN